MNLIAKALIPNATSMIRLDHTHVMATFQQYTAATRPKIKQGLVNTTCLALEVHATLEEEIFYPAVREVSNNEALKKSVPEHDEMRRLIALLRGMVPTDIRYDETYMELMRDVLHHVADEETVVLPMAERLLHDQLDDLGARMLKRRLQLVAPRSADIAVNLARSIPAPSIAMLATAALAGAYLGKRMLRPSV